MKTTLISLGILFSIPLFFVFTPKVLIAQDQTLDRDLEQKIDQLIKIYNHNDFGGIIDLIYPPIFEGISADSLNNLKNSLGSALGGINESSGFIYDISDVSLNFVSPVKSIDSLTYTSVSLFMTTKISKDDSYFDDDADGDSIYEKFILEMKSNYEDFFETEYNEKDMSLTIYNLTVPFIMIKTTSFDQWYCFDSGMAMMSQNENLYSDILELMMKE